MENKISIPSLQQVLLSRFIMLILAFLMALAATAQPGPYQKPTNELFAGVSVAGKSPGNLNYGANFSFTHPLHGNLRLAGDAGIYFRNNETTSLKQFQLLGGAELQPANMNSKILFSPHLLLGATIFNSKYKFETMSFSNNQAGVCLAAGTNILFPINNKTAFAIRTDYTPTLMGGYLNHDFRLGAGLKINIGKEKPPHTPDQDKYTTAGVIECNASKATKELKIQFTAIKKIAESIEKVANAIPRVEAKVSVEPELNVKRGEECCSSNKPPVKYTELRGGVEGGFEITINLWGMPDIKYEVSTWTLKVGVDLKCKLYVRNKGKINLSGNGKFYGELGDPSRSDCKACWYLDVKAESTLGIGVTAGGGVYVYTWPFKNKTEPDVAVEAIAEANVSAGHSFEGTYGSGECSSPKPGLHGVYNIGKAKADLKFKVKAGPLTFNLTYEYKIWDGLSFEVHL